jgi:hypothetical protein
MIIINYTFVYTRGVSVSRLVAHSLLGVVSMLLGRLPLPFASGTKCLIIVLALSNFRQKQIF